MAQTQTTQDDWNLVGSADAWKPEKEGDEITGIYWTKEEGVGRNGSNMYMLKQDDGEIIGVWGSAIIDSRMSRVQPGREVKIVFRGKIKTQNGREAKNFDVYDRQPAFNKIDGDFAEQTK